MPLFGILTNFFIIKKKYQKNLKTFSLLWSLIIFNISILLLYFLNLSSYQFQLIGEISWFFSSNTNILIGLDGLSYFMILLTTFLIPICLLLSWNIEPHTKTLEYINFFFLLESILIGIFCSLDLFLFYILFEAVLIPMYFIVGIFGSRERKIRASYFLFLYTLVSSILMFVAILFLYFKTGTTSYLLLKTFKSFDYLTENICWIAFFFSFAVKMPLVPFHIWLPEAHAEAPTAGSVILAGILLKLGGYGFIRFSLGLFPDSSAFFSPFIHVLSVFGVIYASLTTFQQVDLKKIIAYSSVGHMGLVTAAIFSFNYEAIFGSVFLMLSHGIVSSGLFLMVGFLYEKHHTRVLKYYSGLIHVMPLFSFFFIVFTLGNIGLPGTSSFIGEILIIIGCFKMNSWTALLVSTGMVLGAGYSLWLCNRLLFGNIKKYSIKEFKDISRREFFILLPFLFLVFFLGLYPDIITNLLKTSILNL